MSFLPFLLLRLRGLDPDAAEHSIRMSPKQSRELADFLAAHIACPGRAEGGRA